MANLTQRDLNGRTGNRIGTGVVAALMVASAVSVVASRGCRQPTTVAPLVEEPCPTAGDGFCDQREAHPFKLDARGNRVKGSDGKDVPNRCYHPDDCKVGNGVCDPGESKDSLDCKLQAVKDEPCIPGDEGARALKTDKLKRPLFSASEFYNGQLDRNGPLTLIQRPEAELRSVLADPGKIKPGSNYFVRPAELEESCKLKDEKGTETVDCAPGAEQLCYCVNACGARPKKPEPKAEPKQVPPPPPAEKPAEAPTGGPCDEDQTTALAPARDAIKDILDTAKNNIFSAHTTPSGGKVTLTGSVSFTNGRFSSARVSSKCVGPSTDDKCGVSSIPKNPIAEKFTSVAPVPNGPTCTLPFFRLYRNE